MQSVGSNVRPRESKWNTIDDEPLPMKKRKLYIFKPTSSQWSISVPVGNVNMWYFDIRRGIEVVQNE